MSTSARFDPKLDKDDKELIAQAAKFIGTTMAEFMRNAAKEWGKFTWKTPSLSNAHSHWQTATSRL